ncbi:MAG: MFS transporter [Phycisphaera sp.]|nr:MFS transporter [Phycisphaera sp.]
MSENKQPLPGVVWATAWVSFLTDMSTEMIYGLLPAFYMATLHLGVAWLGLIEGAAETVASLSKLISGHWSDRTGGRKWWMVAGYGLSTVSKPLLLLSGGGAGAMGLRLADRFGKGIRGAPRDAMISHHVTAEQRGRAFGVQRSLDHAGALLGGLLASGLLYFGLVGIDDLFLWCVIPGAAAVLVILLFVHDKENIKSDPGKSSQLSLVASWHAQSAVMKRYLGVMVVFSLGNSSDMLLLLLAFDQLRASGVSEQSANAALPLLWSLLHVVKTSTSTWGGTLSDRIGRGKAVCLGWGVYGLVYLGFAGYALVGGKVWVWALFAVYGLYFGLVEGPERALVSDLSPDATKRGMAYGLFHFVVGVIALPASLLTAGLWLYYGPAVAFGVGALLALLAMALLPAALRGTQHVENA